MGLEELNAGEWAAVCAAVDVLLDSPPEQHTAILERMSGTSERFRAAVMEVYLRCAAEEDRVPPQ